jgi:hypothetical protein
MQPRGGYNLIDRDYRQFVALDFLLSIKSNLSLSFGKDALSSLTMRENDQYIIA